ncbi:MAG: hypothetical protein HFJ67_10045 [Adlercreutzia mucosicola]|nr:hypothetical protein [Adlercreutzia mucosicola]
MGYLLAALPAIISAALLGVVAKLAKELRGFMAEHRMLLDNARNDNKSHLVATYQRVKERGYVEPIELESANRLYDSYRDLGGNSYIEAIMHDLNNNTPIVGTPIPAIVAAMDAAGKERK